MSFTGPSRETQSDAAEAGIRVSREGSVGWISIDNPRKRNAVSEPMWREIIAVLRTFDGDPDLRCVVVSGQGEKAFCAGADIQEMDHSAKGPPEKSDGLAMEALEKLKVLRKPTIAMISGYCLGAGVAIASACDLRVAARGSTFGVPAARLGLPYNRAGLLRLSALIGPHKTKWMIFTAGRFSAEEAHRFELIDELTALEDLRARVTAMADQIAANAPLTIAAAKYSIDRGFATDGSVARDDSERLEQVCWESRDFIEGRSAFLEKRAPIFIGS